MSKSRKSKKLRRPNVPMTTGPKAVNGGSAAAPAEARASRPDSGQAAFDYTHIKNDLRRIGLLAAGFIALLVVLSFFIK